MNGMSVNLLVLLFVTNCAIVHSLSSPSNNGKGVIQGIRSLLPEGAPGALPWYQEGLDFSCTGCGKCCKVNGDVWLAPEEIPTIMEHVEENNYDEFRKKYIRAEMAPASDDEEERLSQTWANLQSSKEGACVFLNPIGQCSIYDVRPVQCRTYPFWPSLLENREAWEEERVLPDDQELLQDGQRHWSAEGGGCEGIRIGEEAIQIDEIRSKRREALNHWKRFPGDEIKEKTWFL